MLVDRPASVERAMGHQNWLVLPAPSKRRARGIVCGSRRCWKGLGQCCPARRGPLLKTALEGWKLAATKSTGPAKWDGAVRACKALIGRRPGHRAYVRLLG